jgi:zinc transporter 9
MLAAVYPRIRKRKLLSNAAPLVFNSLARCFGDQKDSMVSKSYEVLKKKAQRSPDSLKIENSKKTVYMALGGNMIITASKVAAYFVSGSSVMLSEAIHSLVDSGNQALLLIGLTAADSEADKKYQYGYGKSVYFWSLVSALGTFWCGAGVSAWSSMQALISPSVELHAIGWEIWSVLGVAFAVDGAVLFKTIQKVNHSRPPNVSLFRHITKIRDPTTAAVLWEDAAACGGVLIAVGGISLVSLTELVVFDALAGLAVSGLLASMGLYLARMNQTYLMGQAVEPEITEGIKKILMAGKSIDEVHSVQSQWVGPYSFSYKAEVDFDGTYIAAKLLDRYQSEFSNTQDMGKHQVIG